MLLNTFHHTSGNPTKPNHLPNHLQCFNDSTTKPSPQVRPKSSKLQAQLLAVLSALLTAVDPMVLSFCSELTAPQPPRSPTVRDAGSDPVQRASVPDSLDRSGGHPCRHRAESPQNLRSLRNQEGERIVLTSSTRTGRPKITSLRSKARKLRVMVWPARGDTETFPEFFNLAEETPRIICWSDQHH